MTFVLEGLGGNCRHRLFHLESHSWGKLLALARSFRFIFNISLYFDSFCRYSNKYLLFASKVFTKDIYRMWKLLILYYLATLEGQSLKMALYKKIFKFISLVAECVLFIKKFHALELKIHRIFLRKSRNILSIKYSIWSRSNKHKIRSNKSTTHFLFKLLIKFFTKPELYICNYDELTFRNSLQKPSYLPRRLLFGRAAMGEVMFPMCSWPCCVREKNW